MKQRGFTIIEAVITISIIGLLLAATLPSAGAWIRNTRIRSAAESIQNGLQVARNEAVRRNTNISFWLVSDVDAISMSNSCALSSNSAAWVVSVSSPAGACASDPSTTSAPMIVSKNAAGDTASGLNIAALDGAATAASSVTFNGFGQVTGATPIACIRVRNATAADSRPLSIWVSSSGQVRMCDPAVSDGNDPRKCTPDCA